MNTPLFVIATYALSTGGFSAILTVGGVAVASAVPAASEREAYDAAFDIALELAAG